MAIHIIAECTHDIIPLLMTTGGREHCPRVTELIHSCSGLPVTIAHEGSMPYVQIMGKGIQR